MTSIAVPNSNATLLVYGADRERMTKDDASWILTNAFLILTMQSGFGLLECGCVSFKNIANIMVKNVVDVTLGGITYWTFGYGLSFGPPSTPVMGYGNFFVATDDVAEMGYLYTHYVFQFSFATAATTIVSGAVAERMQLQGYMIFSVLNTFIYCLPCCWVWNKVGFLRAMGFFDFAGGAVVHTTGGASSLIAAVILGPRVGRFATEDQEAFAYSSPVTALTGTFMLWWAWLGFNCGSTFGIDGHLWKIAAKVAVTTLNGSIAGGIVGMSTSYVVFKGTFDVSYIITSILGGLVGVTAGCAVISPAEALFIGAVGAAVALLTTNLLLWARIDDPVGAIPVHLGSATWGVLAIGVFGRNDFNLLVGNNGLLHGGDLYLLGVQAFSIVLLIVWSMVLTGCIFLGLKRLNLLRMEVRDEVLGADWTEHQIRSQTFSNRLEKALKDVQLPEEDVDNFLKKVVHDLSRNPSPNGAAVSSVKHVEIRSSVATTYTALNGGSHQANPDHHRNSSLLTTGGANNADVEMRTSTTSVTARSASMGMYTLQVETLETTPRPSNSAGSVRRQPTPIEEEEDDITLKDESTPKRRRSSSPKLFSIPSPGPPQREIAAKPAAVATIRQKSAQMSTGEPSLAQAKRKLVPKRVEPLPNMPHSDKPSTEPKRADNRRKKISSHSPSTTSTTSGGKQQRVAKTPKQRRVMELFADALAEQPTVAKDSDRKA